MKKYSFRLLRGYINLDEINVDNVECTGKSIFNIWMAFLSGVCSIVCIIQLAREMLHSIQGVFAYVFINLIFIVPFSYYLLKIINYKFSINNDKIIYKNIFGIIYEYDFRNIKNVKHIKGSHRIPEIFIIKMENKKIL